MSEGKADGVGVSVGGGSTAGFHMSNGGDRGRDGGSE